MFLTSVTKRSKIATCEEATLVMDSVVMPSDVEITGLGREARCMQCHQGRHSTVSVDESIAEVGPADEDTVSEELGFANIHYYAVAASKYGTVAKGGYEYEGKSYDANFAHVEAFDTCVECHNLHTLELKVEACSTCHAGVASAEDLRNVRMESSVVDYDGDGDVTEGIYYELEGVREVLYQAIQAYASTVSGTPVVYDAHAYPYFFDEAEERYGTWTPRLLRAAYNYQYAAKDPGAFAHNGQYVIQVLYDSLEDIGTQVSVDMSGMTRP